MYSFLSSNMVRCWTKVFVVRTKDNFRFFGVYDIVVGTQEVRYFCGFVKYLKGMLTQIDRTLIH